MREFDREKLRLTGPEHGLFTGALVDAEWAEGPRLFRRDGFYYLVLAEGGTGHMHAVTVARSEHVTGPYRNNPGNPVLTHRHLGRDHPIAATGHADLVQTPDGDWVAVLLAIRPYGGYFYNLGRETFLATVAWEDGWPIVNPGVGQVLAEFPVPLPAHPWPPEPETDHFDAAVLAPMWNFLRTPREDFFSLADRPGHLRLRLRPQVITEPCDPSFVGRRQQHMNFTARTVTDFEPTAEGECAGLVLLRGTDHQIHLVITVSAAPGDGVGGKVVRAVTRQHGRSQIIQEAPLGPGQTHLAVEAAGQDYTLRYSQHQQAQDQLGWRTLGTVDGRILSPLKDTDFTGAYLGMYASSSGHPAAGFADFDSFTYSPRD
jgi:alpha-N-arabinofuranosidase